MTALDPACPENAAEAPSPKWTSERVAFITEQYLIYRKSGGEIARMLGPAFTRNSVTGKLFRTGALKARSGMGLRSDHGLPRGANFGNPKVRVPEEARGCQASSSRETARGRASSSRARRRGFRQEDRGSLRDRRHRAPRAPRKASAAGRQDPSMARRMSAARRKFAGLIAKPMPPSPIEARARQHPRSRSQISKQAPLEAGAGPLLERMEHPTPRDLRETGA